MSFALPAPGACGADLLLYEPGAPDPFAVLPFPDRRVGERLALTVRGRLPDVFEYGYRLRCPGGPGSAGPILTDPYARAFGERGIWGQRPDRRTPYPYRAKVAPSSRFDWGDDRPPRVERRDLVVYELHVRGFTRHSSSGVRAPGTYAGLVDKLPYLRRLGVTCVELLPIFEFDETDNPRNDPEGGRPLVEYWGYNTVGYFAPKASYAADPDDPATEFKQLVKACHAQGIEVVLDVVFNHTAEGGRSGPTISFRGLDEAAYYLLDATGAPRNLTGAGNTVWCNGPAARGFILDCLRFWVTEYHIDGFRFDEASILTRDASGAVLPDPPVLAEIAHDPVLRDVRLIAEPWDPGLDLVGRFGYGGGRWLEWNPRYRDALRRFLRGDPHSAGELATRMLGSHDLYADRGPGVSVNYVTAHDGLTLHDLVGYDRKHNEANGEQNQDGAPDEISCGYGADGPTPDPAVQAVRSRQARNALLLLLASHGTPMLTAGDELGRSQGGNSNAYCHDDESTWLDWGPARDADDVNDGGDADAADADLSEFVRRLLALRRAHPALRAGTYGRARCLEARVAEPVLAILFGDLRENAVLLAANCGAEPTDLHLEPSLQRTCWSVAVNTADMTTETNHTPLDRSGVLRLAARSAVLLVAAGSGP